jgi:SAM-dependent methyltransferase
MSLSTTDWHQRFLQQAQWTQDLRAYLYPKAGLEKAKRILDVGFGTGALWGEIQRRTEASVVGVDIHLPHLMWMQQTERLLLSQGDAHHLPYQNNSFDVSLCHFTLLWLEYPARALAEIERVTRPGGAMLALAEPDYGGRIDYPPELEKLGRWQSESLRIQGADPLIGRKLGHLFGQAGFVELETGVLGGQWSGPPSLDAWEREWEILEADLKEKDFRDVETLKSLKALDKAAWERGERVLFVPTFYAFGRVPMNPKA